MSTDEHSCVGLIGGLGVGAAVHYYKALAAAQEQAGRPLHLLMHHADMRRVFRYFEARDHGGLAGYLAGLFRDLKAGGATVGAIPAVTPHICIEELAAISPLPLVSMVDPVDAALRARGIRKAALFGTRFTMESRFFGLLPEVEFVAMSPEEVAFIHGAYFQFASGAAGADENKSRLVEIGKRLHEEGAEVVLLAGTDLAPVFGGEDPGFAALDCTAVHIDAILDELSG